MNKELKVLIPFKVFVFPLALPCIVYMPGPKLAKLLYVSPTTFLSFLHGICVTSFKN